MVCEVVAASTTLIPFNVLFHFPLLRKYKSFELRTQSQPQICPTVTIYCIFGNIASLWQHSGLRMVHFATARCCSLPSTTLYFSLEKNLCDVRNPIPSLNKTQLYLLSGFARSFAVCDDRRHQCVLPSPCLLTVTCSLSLHHLFFKSLPTSLLSEIPDECVLLCIRPRHDATAREEGVFPG